MPRFVIGDQAALILPQRDRPPQPEQRALDRLVEVIALDGRVVLSRRDQGGLVHDIAEIGTYEPRGRPRDVVEVDIRGDADAASMDAEDRGATHSIGR